MISEKKTQLLYVTSLQMGMLIEAFLFKRGTASVHYAYQESGRAWCQSRWPFISNLWLLVYLRGKLVGEDSKMMVLSIFITLESWQELTGEKRKLLRKGLFQSHIRQSSERLKRIHS